MLHAVSGPAPKIIYNLQHRLVECYVFVNDSLKAHPKRATRWRPDNDILNFTDAEAIPQLVGGDAPAAVPARPGSKQ